MDEKKLIGWAVYKSRARKVMNIKYHGFLAGGERRLQPSNGRTRQSSS